VIVPLRQAGEAQLSRASRSSALPRSPSWSPFSRAPDALVEAVEVIGERAGQHASRRLDMADVVGQVEAKWACEVAAAGRHHMLFHGRLASARRCSPSEFQAYFLILMFTTPLKFRRSTRLLDSISLTN
jgi:hypothetical protein